MCEMWPYWYWLYCASTGIHLTLSNADYLNLCTSSAHIEKPNFERCLMNHLDPKDLSKSTPTPNCTEVIVELGLDACVIDFPIFSTLMI